jgi:hypothetical protein
VKSILLQGRSAMVEMSVKENNIIDLHFNKDSDGLFIAIYQKFGMCNIIEIK